MDKKVNVSFESIKACFTGYESKYSVSVRLYFGYVRVTICDVMKQKDILTLLITRRGHNLGIMFDTAKEVFETACKGLGFDAELIDTTSVC